MRSHTLLQVTPKLRFYFETCKKIGRKVSKNGGCNSFPPDGRTAKLIPAERLAGAYTVTQRTWTPGINRWSIFDFCKEITKLLLCKNGLSLHDFTEIHAPYGSYGSDSSDSSDSSKLGGIWITGRKEIVINIF